MFQSYQHYDVKIISLIYAYYMFRYDRKTALSKNILSKMHYNNC